MNTSTLSANGPARPDGAAQSAGVRPHSRRLVDPALTARDDGGQVKLALFGRPVPELLRYASTVYEAMEGNEHFPEPLPPQDELAAVLADANACALRVLSLQSSLAEAVARRDEVIDQLVLKLNQRGNYVQMASGGNSSRILSAGIDVRRARRPVGELDVPTGLSVELNGTAGVATLTWDKVKNAKMYSVEYGPVDGPKIQQPVTGLRKLILNELPLGVMYQFRVSALGGATGQSDWGPWVTRGIA